VKGITELTRNGTQGESDITCFDDEGVGNWLTGIKNSTFALSMINNRGRDNGQEILLTGLENGTRPQYRYYPLYAPLSGEEYFEGRCFLTADDRVHAIEGGAELNVTMRTSGESRGKQTTTDDQV